MTLQVQLWPVWPIVNRAAGELLHHGGDGPLRLILSRASAALMNDGADFDPVWSPPGK